jgi:hypothetical protein
MSFGPINLISSIMISNEAEDVSGRTSAEIERVIYVRVKDFGFLERANGAERQEQWSIKVEKTDDNAGSGSVRVRKSTNLREPGAAVQYVLTSKLDIGQMGSSAETPEQSSLDQFNIFKYLASKGMLKDRYYYPIEGSDLSWEVDCFPKPGAMYHEWVKIDLEKWPRGKELPALPMEFLEMMDGSEGMQTDESKEKISKLYEEIFLIPNTNSPLADYGNTDPAGGATDEEGQNKENDQGAGNADDPNGADPGKVDDGSTVDADGAGKGSGSDDDSSAGAGEDAGGGDKDGKDAAGKTSEGDDTEEVDGGAGTDTSAS